LASGDWLEDLETQVKANLGSKPVLLVWGMKDVAFRPKFLTRMQEVFPDRVVAELPQAKHYIQEDAPDEIIAAIIDRFD
jgi:haloalkane dehalogenase